MSQLFITYTLLGRPVSKKNSKQIYRNHKTGKSFIVSSKAHSAFENDALSQLLSQKKGNSFTESVRIDYTFYQKGKLTQDFDNAIGTVNDLLQKAGIIVDDKQITEFAGVVIRNQAEWKTQIAILGL